MGTGCSALLPGINRRPNLCPPGTGPTRLRQEGWLQSAPEAISFQTPTTKQERAERKKVLALAQARKVDVILVTELIHWGRSARFAARSLTCFKVRFVSSPLTCDNLQEGLWMEAFEGEPRLRRIELADVGAG